MPRPLFPRSTSDSTSDSLLTGRDYSAPSLPERSPLEPDSAFSRRLRKDRVDNAKWEGQRRAIRLLDKKSITIPQTPDPKLFP